MKYYGIVCLIAALFVMEACNHSQANKTLTAYQQWTKQALVGEWYLIRIPECTHSLRMVLSL